jgi:preprotein translocase subunit SecG
MGELFRDSSIQALAKATLWFAAIFALLALAVVAVRRWRGGAYDAQPTPSELLTKFREMHGRGSLSDNEYRTIKTKLARQIDSELKDNDQTS